MGRELRFLGPRKGSFADHCRDFLREHGFVGRFLTLDRRRQRITQHRRTEGLRRLRKVDVLAGQRLGHGALAIRAFHRVPRLYRGDRTAVLDGRVDRACDQRRRHERPRGIVDDDDVCMLREGERVSLRDLGAGGVE